MSSDLVELAGRAVHRVGYGAMQLAPRGRTAPTHEEGVALLRAAAALGVDHIDTAEFYGESVVNRMIADAFPDADSSPLIATKVGARDEPGREFGLVTAQRPDQLRDDIHANLRTLGRDRIDLVYIRRTDVPPGIVATGEQIVPLDDQLAELIRLRDEGLVGAIGLGSVTADQVRQAVPAGIAAVQNLYNLRYRDSEDVLQVARENDIAWVPFFPLGSGFPGQPKVTELPTVVAAADELGATPAQVGLSWLLANYDKTLLIPGSLNIDHVRENFEAAGVSLGGREL